MNFEQEHEIVASRESLIRYDCPMSIEQKRALIKQRGTPANINEANLLIDVVSVDEYNSRRPPEIVERDVHDELDRIILMIQYAEEFENEARR